MRRLVFLGVVAIVGAGCAGSHPSHRAAAAKRPPSPMTPKIVACQRSGKLICDAAAYRRDRARGEFPFSHPDPKGARLLTLRRVLPRSWRGKDYAAALMTYGHAQEIASGLAGATRIVVDPRRKFWVLTLFHRPPIRVPNTTTAPASAHVPATLTVRSESQTIDALTGQGVDSCINCAAFPAPVSYPAFGVTLTAPPAGYRPAISAGEVLSLLRSSGLAGSDLQGRPSVKLYTVGHVHPYPAWVVTFRHTWPTTSYGPAPVLRRAPVCTWVLIYGLRTGRWKDDFQSCPDRAVHPLSRVEAEIAAARATNPRLFAIFPAHPGKRSCAIPAGGLVRKAIVGTCLTRVWYPNTHGHGEARVVFREDWHGLFSSWTLWEELPMLKVLVTKTSRLESPQVRSMETEWVWGARWRRIRSG